MKGFKVFYIVLSCCALLMAGCRSGQSVVKEVPVEVPTPVVVQAADSSRVEARDSSWHNEFHSSDTLRARSTERRGDTVFIHDTIRIHDRDSVSEGWISSLALEQVSQEPVVVEVPRPYPVKEKEMVEVEKPLKWWQSVLIVFGWAFIVLLIFSIIRLYVQAR